MPDEDLETIIKTAESEQSQFVMQEANKNTAVKKDTEMRAWEDEYARRILSRMNGWGHFPYDAGLYGSIGYLRTYHDLIHNYEMANEIDKTVKVANEKALKNMKESHENAVKVLKKAHEENVARITKRRESDLDAFKENSEIITNKAKGRFDKAAEAISNKGYEIVNKKAAEWKDIQKRMEKDGFINIFKTVDDYVMDDHPQMKLDIAKKETLARGKKAKATSAVQIESIASESYTVSEQQ